MFVAAAVREAWERPTWKVRCYHEDGRGQCTSRDTVAVWPNPYNRGRVVYLCSAHRGARPSE